ncbi:acyltransferase [Pedobacter sp. MC2016-15]|uniref:acyltransferase family protein n=1 Tax=Pedobacter sp. MC2016-15 TaxID=2994473 RepID=UPI0022454624|nr:acyltransferase [Pedobacter sp. MC2016-15]MCX2481788.1 acyltransferase [Pedobacter sp. MC2016-15]
MSDKSKITSLALLRGIAVVSVCFCHFAKPISKGTVAPELFRLIGEYGQYGVHIFFVISGFVIPFSLYRAKYELVDYFRFLYKRLLRLHPPYLIALSITLSIAAASYHYRHLPNPETPLTVLKSLFYAHAPSDNPVFWTLRIEAEYYIFMGIYFVLLSKLPRLTMIIGVPLLLLSSQTLITEYIGLLEYIVFFLIGTIGYQIYTSKKSTYFEMACLGLVILFSFLYYELAASIVATATILVILYYRKPVSHILEFPGEVSYSLYLLHFPLGIKMINMAQNHMKPNQFWILFFVVSLICFAVSWVFWNYIEKPSANFSNTVKYGKARTTFKNYSLKD